MNTSWAYRIFFLSGFLSILYEVLWLRFFTFSLGSTTKSVSAITAVFMLGIAIGSFIIGRKVDDAKNFLRWYALLEVFTAITAVTSFGLYFRSTETIARIQFSYSSAQAEWLTMILVVLLVLLPAICIGGTLPALARFVVTAEGAVQSKLGRLYGLHTLGAGLGATLSGIVIIKTFGYLTTFYLVSGATLLLGCFLLWYSFRNDESSRSLRTEADDSPVASTGYRWMLLFAFFVSGFTALYYEVLWYRMLEVYFVGRLEGFGILLGIYLLGLGLGSRVFSDISSGRVAQSYLWKLPLFISATAISALPLTLGAMEVFNTSVASTLLLLWLGLLTFFFGGIFPLLVGVATSNVAVLGSQIGALYSVNTFGSILGALLSGFVFIPLLGVDLSFVVCAGLNLMVGVLLFLSLPDIRFERSKLTIAICVVASAGAVQYGAGAPWFEEFYRGVVLKKEAAQPGAKSETLYFGEHADTTLQVYQAANGERTLLGGPFISGTTDFLRRFTQRYQAHLAMLAHPNPKRVLEIGYGSGEILRSILRHHPDHVDLVEISSEMVPVADEYFASLTGAPSQSERVSTHILDGRHFLKITPEKYDVILSDTMILVSEASLRLYTVEHFEAAKKKLTDDGVLVVWLPMYTGGTISKAIMGTFLSVFPDSLFWMSPINFEGFLLGFQDKPNLVNYRKRFEEIVQPDMAEFWSMTAPGFLAHFRADGKRLAEVSHDNRLMNSDFDPILDFVEPDDFWPLFSELSSTDPSFVLENMNLQSGEESEELRKDLAREAEQRAEFFQRVVVPLGKSWHQKNCNVQDASTRGYLENLESQSPEFFAARYCLAKLYVSLARQQERGSAEFYDSLKRILDYDPYHVAALSILLKKAQQDNDLTLVEQYQDQLDARAPHFRDSEAVN
jgi:spermidine synthase